MKTKYIRDFRRNYLVIEREDSGQSNYLVKMITENSIDGLIPCQERMINGESLLYYDITSRQSVQSILEAQPLQMCHLQKLFSSLHVISEAMEKYLLNPEELLFSPEFVYMDMVTGEYAFIYYPDMSEKEDGKEAASFQKLNDFFMQHMDSENMQLVEAVYQMADLLNRQQFVLDELITWFQQNYDADLIEDTGGVGAQPNRNLHGVQEEGGNSQNQNIQVPDWIRESYGKSTGEKKSIWQRLTEWLFPDRKYKKNGKTANSSQYIRYQDVTEPEKIPEPEDNGHTVFIPWVENSDNKLYGIGKNNKYHIPLQNLPITVGKMAGAVDLVLNDQSVSRLHARISRNGNRFFITDLNSTNGTFRNGMRLEPNASEIIEPGDEIGIGKLKFIYR